MQNATYGNPALGQYRKASIETADRGQLIIMIYDHCIKWCGIAKEAIEAGELARKAEASHKVEAGLNELMSSLNMEKGGDIAKNLWKLYDFYSFHIHEGNSKNLVENFTHVAEMMGQLREAWQSALNQVRQDKTLANNLSVGNKRSYVSMVG